MKLKKATEDGDWELAILTNLPWKSVSAVVVCRRPIGKRWTIEGGFQDLTTTLACEINTLCLSPGAALFVFCVALMAYNLQKPRSRRVMRSEHGAEKVENDLSRYFVAGEIGQVYRGMVMVALPPEEWVLFSPHEPQRLYRLPQEIGTHRRFRPLSWVPHRGPKKAKSKRHYDPEHPHVSVAKLLFARKLKETG